MSGELDRAVRAGIGAAYDAAATTWRGAPAERLYGPLARALVARSPVPLTGRQVIDLGAGTGVVSRALEDAGARVVAADLALGMLAADRIGRPPAVVADAARLPLAEGAADGCASGFCFNHLPDPVAGFAEVARVVDPGGPVLVSTFAAGSEHPAKSAVDAVAAGHGFEPPVWHRTLKQHIEPLTAGAERLAAAARAAGLAVQWAEDVEMDVGMDSPAALADWRLGMATLGPFLAGLSPAARDQLRADAEDAVAGLPPFRPRVALLTALVA